MHFIIHSLFADEWTSTRFYFDNGVVGSIFCLHNGHPKLIPNAIYRALLLNFDGTAATRVATVSFMAMFSALLMARLVVADLGHGDEQARILPKTPQFLAVVSVVLWLANDHKLLSGMAFHDHLAVLGSVIAVCGADRLRRTAPLTDSAGIALAVLGAVPFPQKRAVGK